jgi:regulator of sigma E protease
MLSILSIFGFIGAIALLVIVHEWGHFFVARMCKVKILRFSIGFGKPLFCWRGKKENTEYVFAPILLGGYVKMLDSRETKVSILERHLAFDHKNTWQRLCIILAGPLANFVLAILAFLLIFSVGFQMPKPIVGKILPNSLASIAGLHPNDEIVKIDSINTKNWQEVIIGMIARIGDSGTLTLQVQRNYPHIHHVDLHVDLVKWQTKALNPSPLQEFGIIPYHPAVKAVIGFVAKNSPAARIGLRINDYILVINGEKIKTWDDVNEYIKFNPLQRLDLMVSRDHHNLPISVILDWKFGPDWKQIGYLGIKSCAVTWPKEKLLQQKYPILAAFVPAYNELQKYLNFNVMVLKKIITGKLSLRVLGGPITIFQTTTFAMQQGLIIFIGVLGIISATLGFINLLPIPSLDGGNCVMVLIETLLRKSLSFRVHLLILRLGMIVLFLILMQATYNDLMRIFVHI